MIIELLFSAIIGIINLLLSALPSIPSLDDSVINAFSNFFDTLSMGKGIFFFFIRPSTAITCLSIALIIVNFEHIYKFLMFIIKKIPFINIQ